MMSLEVIRRMNNEIAAEAAKTNKRRLQDGRGRWEMVAASR